MPSPITSTIRSLFPQSTLSSDSSAAPSFDSSNLILIRNGASAPPDDIKCLIKTLVEAAQAAASSLACSSILAGQGSESDDDGDVGLWLGKGDYGEGHEREVLEALGLQGWAQGEEVRDYSSNFTIDLLNHPQIVPVKLQPPHFLPTTLPANIVLKSNNPGVDVLTKLLPSFKQKHCFRVKKGGPRSGGSVAFFLLGQLDDQEWGGLVGIGVWADE